MSLHLEKCPVCRARRSPEASEMPTCPRCGADLEPVILCYRQARALRNHCRRLLAVGRFPEALGHAKRARFLLNEPEIRQTLAAALLANNRVSTALTVLNKMSL